MINFWPAQVFHQLLSCSPCINMSKHHIKQRLLKDDQWQELSPPPSECGDFHDDFRPLTKVMLLQYIAKSRCLKITEKVNIVKLTF